MTNTNSGTLVPATPIVTVTRTFGFHVAPLAIIVLVVVFIVPLWNFFRRSE